MNLIAENLTRRFGRTVALDGVSFQMQPGRVHAFVGPNGAGKTTTMRIIATLDTPTSGDVTIDGRSVVEYPERARRLIGYMPDALPAHSDIVVREYLEFFARAFGIRQPVRTRVLAEIESFTGLAPLREKTLSSLSKGMKQRVSLARALVHDPAVLILDEPAAGLDPHARIELRELITALAHRGKSILISSHILHELEEMVDDVIIVQHGKVVRHGSIDALAGANRNGRATESAPAARRMLVRLAGAHAGHTESDQEQEDRFTSVAVVQPGVIACHSRGHRAFQIDIEGDDDRVAAILAAMVTQDIPVVEFRTASSGLERLFLEATSGVGSAK